MKCFTARWTTALAAAAWLGLPAAGLAQAPPTPAPAAASSVTQQPPAASAASQPGAAQEHIRQAQAAFNDIPAAALTGRLKTRMTELERHLSALEKSAAGNWATEVAAIDKILTELLAPAASATAATPTLDETAKTKLTEVRTHVTAFASAMSGTAPNAAPEPSSPSSAASASTMANPPATSAQPPAAPPPAAPATAAATSAAPTTSTEQTPPPAAQGDPETAKRHLTSARNALSQLTQLPAATQLSGEPRTQVSQLITNFNALITATSDWRTVYDKVNANLTALIGAQSADESLTPPAGAAGAVGTSGTMASSLDPAIKAKLVEFRNHLIQFEKAAGGSPASTSASEPATTATPASATSSTPGATGTTGSVAVAATGSTGAVGTSGAAAGGASAQERPAQQRPATPPASEATDQDNPMRHIEAIEAILSGRSGATGTTGAAGSTAAAASLALDSAQLEQIRMHLAELRKIVDKK